MRVFSVLEIPCCDLLVIFGQFWEVSSNVATVFELKLGYESGDCLD